MRILQIAPIDRRVPPQRYGAIERVVYWLVEGLVKRGHHVLLLAAANSKTSAELLPIIDMPLCDRIGIQDLRIRDVLFTVATGRILETAVREKFDVVHNHLGWRLLPFWRLVPAPFITTLQTPLDSDTKSPAFVAAGNAPIVTVSKNQQLGRLGMNYVATIPNGVPLETFRFSSETRGYLLFMGRMANEKGPIEAIKIARALGKPLIMAAAVHAWEEEYFRREVLPLIDGEQVSYIGEVNDAEKNVLLGEAEALLNPIQWEEPFGIVCVEAMACGTPVLTLRRGAMPEVVVDKHTGIVASDVGELIERFPEIKQIRRIDCRTHVEQHFGADRMVESYLSLYKALAAEDKGFGGHRLP